MKQVIDAGTSFSKIILSFSLGESVNLPECAKKVVSLSEDEIGFVIPTKDLKKSGLVFDSGTGHMSKPYLKENSNYENELMALAFGVQKLMPDFLNGTVLDIGSRDTKWIRFENGKYKELDWNNSCGSATGATIEMICNFYDVNPSQLAISQEKYPVTCGVFGMEKIMDDISKGESIETAISRYIHGIAYNTWLFAQKPSELYLSGGFCENKCFVESLKLYAKVETLGRFVLAKGLL